MSGEAGRPGLAGGKGAEIDAERLRTLLTERGLRLRPEDEAATLATARFLLRAADLVRRAAA
jgi:hypothetical protein